MDTLRVHWLWVGKKECWLNFYMINKWIKDFLEINKNPEDFFIT